MSIFTEPMFVGMATLNSSLSALIWSIRRQRRFRNLMCIRASNSPAQAYMGAPSIGVRLGSGFFFQGQTV
jgi:hypothetical protein